MSVSRRSISLRVGAEHSAFALSEKIPTRPLSHGEEHYRAIFENANDAIAFIALDGTITRVNRSAERLAGLSRGQIIERPFTQFLTPASVAFAQERIERALAGEPLPSTFEIELLRPNGRTVAIEARARFLRGQDRAIVGILGIYRDITERKQAEEALRQVHAKLEQRVQERTADLARANEALRAEIVERKRAEEAARAAEREYRALFENAVEGIYRSSLDGHQLRANPALVKLNGYESEAEMLPAVNDIAAEWYVDPHRREEFQRILAQRESVTDFESEIYRHKTRERIWISETARLVRDQYGTPLYYEGTVQDITARKRAETETRESHFQLETRVRERTAELQRINAALQMEIEERKRIEAALRKSEERYRDLFENANDVIGTGTLDNIIVSANRRVEQLLGYPRDEFVGKYFLDFATPKSRALIEERTHRRLAGEEVSPMVELELVHRDNSIVIVEGIVRTQRDPDGKPIGVHAIYRDITERKKVEQLKDELISTVSHELRTPLASLRGFTELMLKRDFPAEKRQELLSVIHSESIRLSRLIDDFLDLQRIEEGHSLYSFAPVILEPLLHEISAVFTKELRTHSLRLDIAPSLPAVRADANRLRQVLANLLSNAIKFSPQGGEIVVGAQTDTHKTVVWVKDRGIGIPQEAVPKLFTKFFRVDNSDTRDIGGTGLGLALVREILTAHQGNVWVESTQGNGSTFFFTLPHASLNT